MNGAKTLTVFTPAYNRAHTLPRTYESLCGQDCKDFVWLIVDDGSSDGTGDLVRAWQKEDHGFEIRYIYQENGGMHAAHNTAYRLIDTELNTCIDSDDRMAPGAVRKILEKWEQVKELGYAGIVGLDADMNTGRVIGKDLGTLTETTLNGYYIAGGIGDKKLVYRTDVVHKYPPYPIFPGEKYVSLGTLYEMIDQDYQLAVLNEVLCEVEYQPDGSSNSMLRQYLRNPQGFLYARKLALTLPIPWSTKRKWMLCTHYVSSAILSGNRHFLKESPKKLMTLAAVPAGCLLTAYIKWKAK